MKDIFDFIIQEESAYSTLPVAVVENYEWSMQTHINTTILYKNSQYITGKDDNKPFKNIIRPILNLQYRSEGFDVKDIILFVDDADQYYMSFLVKKYHEKWARENHIDTFIDDMVESYVDFGGALIKNVYTERPELVPFQSLAFCDQTDILSGPLAIKHQYSPDQLLAMAAKGWGDPKNGATGTLQEVITLSQKEKTGPAPEGKKTKTPGKYIEVYEVHGALPTDWLINGEGKGNEQAAPESEEHSYTPQIQIVTMYPGEDGKKKGIVLFKGKEKKSIFKLILRDKIYGRALGFGGAEELFEPQVWINYDVIHMKNMKDMAAKMLFQTTDPAFNSRNKTTDLDNGEILVTATDTSLTQVNTQPVSITVFENSVKDWTEQAQMMGAATDSIIGNQPPSGTPFDLQNLVTQEAHSLHEYRKGKLATFLDEVYQDWIIPYIAKEISKGTEFLASLDLDELQTVADNLVTCQANDMIKEKILNGEAIQDSMVEEFKTKAREQFMKGGNKRFIKILQGELKDAPISVQTDIAGKQKDLAAMTDKLSNIVRMILANPALLDDPRMAKIFNQILEASGLSPIDFYQKPAPQQNNAPANKVSESINFKDLPSEGQVQLAGQAGIKITPPQQTQTVTK